MNVLFGYLVFLLTWGSVPVGYQNLLGPAGSGSSFSIKPPGGLRDHFSVERNGYIKYHLSRFLDSVFST